jgi:hypothetical protein
MQPSPFCSYFLDIEKELENVKHTTHVLKTLDVKQFLDRTTSSCISKKSLESAKSCPAKLNPSLLVKKRQVYPVRFNLDLNFTHRYRKT